MDVVILVTLKGEKIILASLIVISISKFYKKRTIFLCASVATLKYYLLFRELYNTKQRLEDDITRLNKEIRELKNEERKLSVEVNPLQDQIKMLTNQVFFCVRLLSGW